MTQLSEKEISEIKSLVKLLDDEDGHIFVAARDRLLHYGEPALAYVVQLKDSSAATSLRFKELRDQIIRSAFKDGFRNLKHTDANDVDLEEGIFLIARQRFPDLNVSKYIDQLNTLALELKEKLTSDLDHAEIFRRMISFFVDQKKFTGNLHDYYNEDNYYINRVLETQTGIPITLSAVYLLVGRRINLPLIGIGLPGHFSLQYSIGSTNIFFDPYNNGTILSRTDCEEMVKGLGFTFSEEYLRPVTNKQIIERMLRNIILSLEKNDEKEKIETIRQFIDSLNSDV